MPEVKRYSFGLSDITIGTGADMVKFDGKDFLQAEEGGFSLTPQLIDIMFEDFGEIPVEKRLSGYEGEITVVAGQENAKLLQLALAATTEIAGTEGESGFMDAAIGKRIVGHEVRIHPRTLPTENEAEDFVIFNAASTGGLERSNGHGQNSFTITLTMMPREGFAPSEPGNYFYKGSVDPREQ